MKQLLLFNALLFILLTACTAPNSQIQQSSSSNNNSSDRSPSSAANLLFDDDFNNLKSSVITESNCIADDTTIEQWLFVFAGFGCNSVVSQNNKNYISLSPQSSTDLNTTHAGLVVGPSFADSYIYKATFYTSGQLRQNNPANTWEVAWAIWNYQDNTHFYYFIPKPNGWELGKADPAFTGAQKFLVTGESPKFELNQKINFKVVQKQNTMSIYIDEQLITTYTDNETPYLEGRIGFYTEDAHVLLEKVSVYSVE